MQIAFVSSAGTRLGLEMTQVPLFHRWWGKSAIALFLAILIPVLVFLVGWTDSPGKGIAIGICSWAIGMIFQILHLLHSFRLKVLEFNRITETISENDQLLLELQSRLREVASRTLSGSPNRVFSEYCQRSLKNCLNLVGRTAKFGQLEVRDHHFETVDTVLSAFEGSQDRTFRCVWLVESGEPLFDDYWREYMKSIIDSNREKSDKSRLIKVRILFVCDEIDQLDRKSFRIVLG